MRQWIKLLADRIVKAYSNTSVGHAARLNGLGSEEAQELCGLLRDRLDARWDTMVVATEPKTDREVGLDVAIERRNDKGKSRLFIVPANLAAEAAASLADTEAHDITEDLRPIANVLLRGLPRDLRHVVEEAIKRTSGSARLDYLCALPESVTAADCGRELWRLGLILDLSPRVGRFPDNRNCVAKLTDPREAGGSIHQRVEATGLGNADFKERLVRLLRETQEVNPRAWLRRIAEEPELGLTFDQWTFPEREQVNLQAIEVHSFIDSQGKKAYTWSGLKLEDGTLKASTPETKAKVVVHWSTEPALPTGKPLYEIILETSEPQPISLLTETQSHRISKTQSWSFRPPEVEGMEGGSLQVRVVIRSYVEERDEWVTRESDEFLLVSEVVEPPSSSTFPLTRSLPDFLLERAGTAKANPEVTQCAVESGSAVTIELDERQRRRIPLNGVLHAAEQMFLEEPTKASALCLHLSPEVRWTVEHLKWTPLDADLQSAASAEWWRTRRRLFTEIAQHREGHGIVEACEVMNYIEDILSYCRGYANALDRMSCRLWNAPMRFACMGLPRCIRSVHFWTSAPASAAEVKGYLRNLTVYSAPPIASSARISSGPSGSSKRLKKVKVNHVRKRTFLLLRSISVHTLR